MNWQSLTRAFGKRRACDLSLTGRAFYPADAQAWGLLQEVVPLFELKERTLQMAGLLAPLSPAAVAAGQALAYRAPACFAPEWWEKVIHSPDFLEALTATRERRKPSLPSLKIQKERGSMPALRQEKE